MTTPTDIHSCSYFCTRPACVLAQRDEMRAELARLREQEPVAYCNGDALLSFKCGNELPLKLSETRDGFYKTPLYAAPPAQPAPAQEPAQRLSDADFDMQIAGLAMIEATMTIDGKPTLGMAGAEQAWSMVEAAICPPGYVVVRDDFDATECIAAGNKLYRYAQGTGPCVAFYRGAQWLAAAQKAQP